MLKIPAKKLNKLMPPIISQNSSFWRFLCSRIKLCRVGGYFFRGKERPLTKPLYMYWVNKQIIILIISLIPSCQPYPAFAEPIKLTASWYSTESLKKEGTFKCSKGVQANGELFDENALTCASWDFPLKTKLRITTVEAPKKSIIVEVTDRTNKRFNGKRIDLSKRAFGEIANLEQGLCEVFAEPVN